MELALTLFLVVMVNLIIPQVTQAADVTCRVPNGVLHDACVTHLSVIIRKSHCVITFVPVCYGIHGTGKVASRLSPGRAKPNLTTPTSSCFVFNGERYCE